MKPSGMSHSPARGTKVSAKMPKMAMGKAKDLAVGNKKRVKVVKSFSSITSKAC